MTPSASGGDAEYDVVVIGGGHAGIEAALAAARMGVRTALVTFDRRALGRMSCNPAIGGLGKGQMVREIDALGGEMGRAADRCGIQFRLLNTRKGPAVRAPRAQCDKHRYEEYMVRVCSATDGLTVVEGCVERLRLETRSSRATAPCGAVRAVVLDDGSEIPTRSVVVTSGTFLRGLLHCGDETTRGGRVGEGAAYGLADFLADVGFERGRLKTGTPARVEASTVDWSRTDVQPGDDPPVPFSYSTESIQLPQVPCHIAWTCEATHDLIRANLHRAPMYSGQIDGVGPRYCPSIEDKVVRFASKDAHQIFLEPEGLDTSWIYLNGISTSLPRDVQDGLLRTIPALENAAVHQYGYAVEYDFFPPTQIRPTFETRAIAGLYFAGQICGTSGYEEAAAQGLLAGINAVLRLRDEGPLILSRSEAYIGVLVDDLITECPREPYRMFTSRAEYRLLLRSDNADLRLTETGHRIGLVSRGAFERLETKRRDIDRLLDRLDSTWKDGKTLAKILRQPDKRLADVLPFIAAGADDADAIENLDADVLEQTEIQAKYAAYIERQLLEIERLQRLEDRRIPDDFDYGEVVGLRAESREKLDRVRPISVGQASRISGVTPADVQILLAWVERLRGASRRVARRERRAAAQ